MSGINRRAEPLIPYPRHSVSMTHGQGFSMLWAWVHPWRDRPLAPGTSICGMLLWLMTDEKSHGVGKCDRIR